MSSDLPGLHTHAPTSGQGQSGVVNSLKGAVACRGQEASWSPHPRKEIHVSDMDQESVL